MANLQEIAQADYFDLLKNKRNSKLVQAIKAQQMTHQAPPAPNPTVSALGDYFSKVASGGFLAEHGQNFDDILSGDYGKALDYVGPAPMGGVPAMIGMTAFHGSPHKFNKFSLENIGTGEGAQAYGHGLYFAESPDVAGSYKSGLALVKGGNDYRKFADNAFSDEGMKLTDDSLSVFQEYANQFEKTGGKPQTYARRAQNASRELRDYDTAQVGRAMQKYLDQINRGHLYEVDIPDEHVKNFLDWDAPLSEQPESVQKAIKQAYIDADIGYTPVPDDIGGELYGGLNIYGGNDSQAEVSKLLNSLGIKGIKYYDGMSRGAGEGTRNLVVFDDSIVKTLKRNGEDILPDNLTRQSGLLDDDIVPTDTIPEMLKRQSGDGSDLPQNVDEFARSVKEDLNLDSFSVFEDSKGDLYLNMIEVPKGSRKQGVGSKAINRLTDYADKNNKRLVLEPGLPDDRHGTTSRARLVKFYKGLGFKESKGRDIDYEIGAGKMYRYPKSNK